MTERRAGLEKLARFTRHWLKKRTALGDRVPLLPREPVIRDTLDEQLYETLRHAEVLADPSWQLAGELDLSEAKLNSMCREASGLSAREWWDALRVDNALRAFRAQIETLLDGVELDRLPQIRRRGVKLEDLHRALRRRRRDEGQDATTRAWKLGFRSPARLNFAVYTVTGKSMQQIELEILKEIFGAWFYDHHSCRIIAKNPEPQFKPKQEETRPNWPQNQPSNKEPALTGPSQAPLSVHDPAA